MQRSQKEQQTIFALRQLLQDPDIREEQFEEMHMHILQIVDDGEVCQQLTETPYMPTYQRSAFLPVSAFKSVSPRNPQPLPTGNTAFRTELLARFLVVMFDQPEPEKYT